MGPRAVQNSPLGNRPAILTVLGLAQRPQPSAPAPTPEPHRDGSAADVSLPDQRSPIRPRVAVLALALGDWVFCFAIALTALAPVANWAEMPLQLAAKVGLTALSLKIGLWISDAYSSARRGRGFGSAAAGIAVGAALGWWGASMLPAAHQSQGLMALLAIAAPITLLLHVAIRWGVRASLKAGEWAETAVVVGATDAARRFIANNRNGRHIKVVAVFDDRLSRAPEMIEGAPVLGDIEALLAWPLLPRIDHIVLTVTPAAESRVRDLIARLRLAPNRVSLLLDFEGWSPEMAGVRQFSGGLPAMVMSGESKPRGFELAKRAQDLIVGGALMAAFLPVMAIIAIAIRLDGRGPILFRQERHGLNNRIITIYKFRTMRPGPVLPGRIEQVQADDPRVTKIGKLLRGSSLDELPQLFNVLMGDMSLVGPRPHAVGMRTGSIETCRIVAEYAHRHRLKPGITGWAQVNGSRGPVHTEEEVRERVRLDLEYIERASLWFDMWVLLRTAPALLGDKLRIR